LAVTHTHPHPHTYPHENNLFLLTKLRLQMAIHLSSCKAADTPEQLMMVGVIHYNEKQLSNYCQLYGQQNTLYLNRWKQLLKYELWWEIETNKY